MTMSSEIMDGGRLMLAGFAAGVWVLVSGLLMAGLFGYRDMKSAFQSVGLPIPSGARPFVTHTLVRLITGMGVVMLFAICLRAFSPARAMVTAAGFTWIFGALLPYAVVAEWGLFSWSLAAKIWAWSAGELLIAAAIGRLLYHA